MIEPVLVVGQGGTGRTFRLTQHLDDGSSPPWLVGHPTRPITGEQVTSAVKKAATHLVADDLQWFSPPALAALLDVSDEVTIVASRRPSVGHEDPLLDQLSEVLTHHRPAVRLGFLDHDGVAVAVSQLRAADENAGRAVSSEELDQIHHLSAGSVGLVSDMTANQWRPEHELITPSLIDAVYRRVQRAGAEAEALLNRWCLITGDTGAETPLSLAIRALPDEVDGALAHRAVRVGGLLGDDDQLIPLVAAAVRGRLTGPEQAVLRDAIATATSGGDVVTTATYLLAGTGAVPDAATTLAAAAIKVSPANPALAVQFIDRAEHLGLPPAEVELVRAFSHFHDGAPEALAALEGAIEAGADPAGARVALLGFGIDMRDMRYRSAAQRPVGGDLHASLPALAGTLAGDHAAELDATSNASPLSTVCGTTLGAVTALAQGETSGALGLLSSAADDFDRIDTTLPLGFTPHWIGVLAAITTGDTTAAGIYATQALTHRSGATGEELGLRAVAAYAEIMEGRYSDALDLLRSYPDPARAMVQRDRLLLAGLDAALARRSGDTARLRKAWQRAEAALLRPSASWLLIDFYIELLTAGARLGDHRRVDPVAEQLTEQCRRLPESGPGAVAGLWLQLQIALASARAAGAAGAADTAPDIVEQLVALSPTDRRSQARVHAAAVWGAIVDATADEDAVTAAAQGLRETGDLWEASRLLGQAALDCEDPNAARRMLELARLGTTDQVEEDNNDGLVALGLSERESEVAVLVAEGRTHKEIGAQLYISPKTVEHHVARIRQKLGAGSRAELLAIIRENMAPV